MVAASDLRTEIAENYHEKVRRYVRGKIGNPADAEDVVSDVFCKICERFFTFDQSKASVSTWVYTVTRNAVVDYYRTRKVSSELQETLSSEDETDGRLLSEETLGELADALGKIEPRLRDLIVLHYYENLTLVSVAEKMRMSYSNVKLLHKKALSRLSELMKNL